jgi:cell division protein ZapE
MIQSIIHDLKSQDIQPDKGQLNLINNLISNYKVEKSIFNTLIKRGKKKGAYVWGDVGRGKTAIIKSFMKQISKKSTSYHYIDLMSDIHNMLESNSNIKNPIDRIAKDYCKKYEVIFIDEFQVEDVADAMIIGNLLIQLVNKGVELYITSNAHPDNLYKDGLQRQKFIKSMESLQGALFIYNLDGDFDYRMRNIHQFKKNEISFSSDRGDRFIEDFLKVNFSGDKMNRGNISINSRDFICKASSNNYLWISYSNFFGQPTSSKDFIEICNKFEWVFVSEFEEYDDDHADIIRRFISFIDIAYRENFKVKFFIDSKSINNLYKGSKLSILWNRCASRLQEMQTIEYLESTKK